MSGRSSAGAGGGRGGRSISHRKASRGHRCSWDHRRAALGTGRADDWGVDDTSGLSGELRGAWEARSRHGDVHGHAWNDSDGVGWRWRGAVRSGRSGYDGVVLFEDAYHSARVTELGEVVDVGGSVVVYDVKVEGSEDVDVDVGVDVDGVDGVGIVCAVDVVDGVGDIVGDCWGVEEGVDDGAVEGSKGGGNGSQSRDSESGLHGCWEQKKQVLNESRNECER